MSHSTSPKKSLRELTSVRSRPTLASTSSTPHLTLSAITNTDSPGQLTDHAEEETHLRELTSEIRSKERTLALLNERISGESEELFDQLKERDRKIEDLMKEMTELKAQLAISSVESVSAKEKTIAILQEEKIRMLRDMQGHEEMMTEKTKQIKELEKSLAEERENTELVQEALSEECQALKSQVKIKDDQTKGIRQDILQLSKIVTEMSKLNSELNEKILKMNGDIERLNTRNYQAEATARNTEEVEKGYNDIRKEYAKVQRSNAKLADELARLQELDHASLQAQDRLKSIEESLQSTADFQRFLPSMQEIRYTLKLRTTAKPANDDSIPVLKQEIKELKDELRTQAVEMQKCIIREQTKSDRIEEIEAEKEAIKQQFEESIVRLQLKAKVTEDGFEKMRAKIEFLGEELLKTDSELQKTTVKLTSVQSYSELLKTEKRKREKTESRQEAMIQDMKNQLISLKSQRITQESSIESREKRLRQTAAGLKALMDEIWKKDTEILKLQTALKRMESSLSRKSDIGTSAKARIKAAESLNNVSIEVEKRDSEISLLRDMLRSTQLQLKTRESEAIRLKKKYENDPIREVRAMPSPTRDLSPDRLAVKLDSEIRKIEELAELRKETKSSAVAQMDNVRKVMMVEEVPRDRGKAVEMIAAKMREIAETLEKWTGSKLKTGIQKTSFAGRVKSELLTTMFRDGDSVDVRNVMQRVNAIVAEPVEVQRKRHPRH